MFVGIDIGGTKMAILIVDQAKQMIKQRCYPTDRFNFVDSLINAIETALDSAQIKPTQLLGMGVGIPGMVDAKAGEVRLASNLAIEQPLALANLLTAKFHIPTLIENDTRLSAFGLAKKLPCNNLAYLGLGTGVAAGLVLNGQVWCGTNGMAGEVGHTGVDEHGTLLEHIIAGPAIVEQARSMKLSAHQASDVYYLAEGGNPYAKTIIKKVSRYIGRIIQSLIMTYDVENVVLGGGVTRVGTLFLTPVMAELAQLRSQSALNREMLPDSKITLLPGDFNAGLCGAIRLSQQAVTQERAT